MSRHTGIGHVGPGPIAIHQDISGLTPNTEYEYQLCGGESSLNNGENDADGDENDYCTGPAGQKGLHSPDNATQNTQTFTTPKLTSVDTMKESRDHPCDGSGDTTQAQIDQDVNTTASMNPRYITVDTDMVHASCVAMWVAAIRFAGKHVWFRVHPPNWATSTPPMTPAQYLTALDNWIAANPGLFQRGDILDAAPELENSNYWTSICNADPNCERVGWDVNDPATQFVRDAYNQLQRDVKTHADNDLAALHPAVTGVDTGVRSAGPYYWENESLIYDSTATYLSSTAGGSPPSVGRMFPDDYAGSHCTTTECYSPDTHANAAAAMQDELSQLKADRPGFPIIFGEFGWSNEIPPGGRPPTSDDSTQQKVLVSLISVWQAEPALVGMNYWVGAGGDGYGGWTNLMTCNATAPFCSTGNWVTRPAASNLRTFFQNW